MHTNLERGFDSHDDGRIDRISAVAVRANGETCRASLRI